MCVCVCVYVCSETSDQCYEDEDSEDDPTPFRSDDDSDGEKKPTWCDLGLCDICPGTCSTEDGQWVRIRNDKLPFLRWEWVSKCESVSESE